MADRGVGLPPNSGLPYVKAPLMAVRALCMLLFINSISIILEVELYQGCELLTAVHK